MAPPATTLDPLDQTSAASPALSPDDVAHHGHYQALLSRDARFDGKLFVGVSSTGIYCRPICRVRTPKQANCRFFATAAQAEAATYRPCLKCRPELAPGAGAAWTVMDASRTLARQAAALLDGRAADGDTTGVAALAARLGISERHLRRIFLAEHGVTPLQYLQTRRLLLAKQLLTDSSLPVVQVALASGYRSLRRFNAAFVASYRMSPSRLRAGRTAPVARLAEPAGSAGITVQLAYRAPFDVARLLAFFAQRAIPGIEAITPHRICRSVRAGALSAPTSDNAALSHPAGWVQVVFEAKAPLLRLRFSTSLLPHSAMVLSAVRRWLDLDAHPSVIDAALADLPGEPGLRLPGALDAFELVVRAVLGQQVTVAAARTLARRLVDRFGAPLATPWEEVHRCFPDPSAMASMAVDSIAELGIIRSRAAAIVALAQAWAGLQPALAAGAQPEALIDRLCAVPGIGPWTAQYIAMRALGWPDAFPPGDVAVLKALRALPGPAAVAAGIPQLAAEPALGPSAALAAAKLAADVRSQVWRPWRSYAVLRLWNSLAPAAA